jgi:hypothetical protein
LRQEPVDTVEIVEHDGEDLDDAALEVQFGVAQARRRPARDADRDGALLEEFPQGRCLPSRRVTPRPSSTRGDWRYPGARIKTPMAMGASPATQNNHCPLRRAIITMGTLMDRHPDPVLGGEAEDHQS